MNAAVDDAATMAEGVARMLAVARGRGKMATHDHKRAQMLMVNVAVIFSHPPDHPYSTAYASGLGTSASIAVTELCCLL